MYVCVYACLHEHTCTMCVPSTLRSQKRVLDPLGLELQVAMIHHECWEPNLSTLQGQQVFLATEQSISQPPYYILYLPVISSTDSIRVTVTEYPTEAKGRRKGSF